MIRSLFLTDKGTRPEAVIVDMDGTLENWDGRPHSEGLSYVQHQHAQGRVIIIVTARDHETCYQRTHAWLTRNLTIPFVGPFCRSRDDQRYASAFKEDVFRRLSHLYKIVSAIDDNKHVLNMWRSVGIEAVETAYDYSNHPHVRDPQPQPTAGRARRRRRGRERERFDSDGYYLDPDMPDDDWIDQWIEEQKRRKQ
jgi:hydroxymethylpyrimidine pyrophosphatase-like HAD family hydrolase